MFGGGTRCSNGSRRELPRNQYPAHLCRSIGQIANVGQDLPDGVPISRACLQFDHDRSSVIVAAATSPARLAHRFEFD